MRLYPNKFKLECIKGTVSEKLKCLVSNLGWFLPLLWIAIYHYSLTFIEAALFIFLLIWIPAALLFRIQFVELNDTEIRVKYFLREKAIPYKAIRFAKKTLFFMSRNEIMLHLKKPSMLRTKVTIVDGGQFTKDDIGFIIDYINDKSKL